MSDQILIDLVRQMTELARRVEALESIPPGAQYRGTSAIDFTTTTLPRHGDYGYQTADTEIQINCNGTVRAISTAAL
jgi:hypothetical protein